MMLESSRLRLARPGLSSFRRSLCLLCFAVPAVFLFCFLLLLSHSSAFPSAGPTLIYRKVFKSSSPEFVEIKVSQNGAASVDIRQIEDEPGPQSFEVGRPLVEKLFTLADQLNHFRGAQLDIRRRIANLGQKTFRFEDGSQASETSFNYTTNQAANELAMLFEGLAKQQTHLQTLRHRMKYDRLGVNDALRYFETDFARGAVAEPERLVPVLEAISLDSRLVDIARQRARALIERIKARRRE